MLIVLAPFICYLYTITIAAIIFIYITTSFEYVGHNLYITLFDNCHHSACCHPTPQEAKEDQPQGEPWSEQELNDWTNWNSPPDHSTWEHVTIEEVEHQQTTTTPAE